MSWNEYMLAKLHKFYRSDRWLNHIYKATNRDMQEISTALEDDYKNIFFGLCNEKGAKIFERDLGYNNGDLDIVLRRKLIETNWKARKFSSIALMQDMADSFYDDGNAKVDFINGKINIAIYKNRNEIGPFMKAINRIKPAHLGTGIQIKGQYNLIYKIGLLNCLRGYKQIQISLPEKSNMVMHVGQVHICSGRKKVQIERPTVAVQKTFVGQIIRRTGRITIGGAR